MAISLQEREARLRELEKAPPAAGCAFRLSADGSAKGAVRSRTYGTKAGGLVGAGLLTPGVGEPGA